MLTRRTFLGTASAAAVIAGTGVSFGQAMDIALISKGFQHQFWQAVKAGADKAGAEFGVNVTFEGPENETQVDKQMDMLAAALARKPAAIGFAALDSQAAIPLLQQAKDAGIPIVAFDSGVDSDIPVTTATTDNVAAAALAADKMAELIGDAGKVAVVAHDQTSRTGIDRVDGFVNRMKEAHPKIEVVTVQYGGGDQLQSTEITKSILLANPDLKGIFGANEGLGHRRGQRQEGAQLPDRRHRLRLGRGAEGGDHGWLDGRRHHPEPGRHRLRDGEGGDRRDQGRNAAQGDRHRLLLLRQVEHGLAGNRGRPLRLIYGAKPGRGVSLGPVSISIRSGEFRMADLSGKVILITAAAQGIGQASALAFAKAGAKVIATDINAEKLRELDGRSNITTRVLNVLKAEDVNAAVAEIGRIDILFNCAGVVHSGSVLEMADKDLEFAFDLNVWAQVRTIKACCRRCWSAPTAASSTWRPSPVR
jgi:ribose transport system substrate-binding protein